MSRLIFALTTAIAVSVLSVVAIAESGGAGVTIQNYTFNPQTITVAKGTKVTWVNRDDTPHTVVAVDKKFRSQAMDTGESFAKVFDEVGTFSYVCGLHPQMMGTVVVTPSN